MNLEISHSLLSESQKGLKQIEQVLKGEGQAQHSEATEAILRVLNRIHSCAAVLELDNLSDYTLCWSQAMVTLRDAEA